jgi:hypothetical protein
MKIEEMNLVGFALSGAAALQTHFADEPTFEFTSGRRDRAGQCHAMAVDIAKKNDRRWITRTYRSTPCTTAWQAWIDANPSIIDVPGLATGLLGVLNQFTDDQLATWDFLHHLSGRAFDCAPYVGPLADRIFAAIEALPGLDEVLRREGGLPRLHAQFRS